VLSLGHARRNLDLQQVQVAFQLIDAAEFFLFFALLHRQGHQRLLTQHRVLIVTEKGTVALLIL
jgi:hypothetical protein